MMKHTPTPWEGRPETDHASAHVIHPRTGNVIADVYGGSDEQATANAFLIAAAPDYHEELSWLLANPRTAEMWCRGFLGQERPEIAINVAAFESGARAREAHAKGDA